MRRPAAFRILAAAVLVCAKQAAASAGTPPAAMPPAAMSGPDAGAAAAVPPPPPGGGDVDAIMSRIGPPSPLTLSTYVASGMTAPTNHPLTPGELRRVRAALERLPPFYRRMLALHLHRLSFVDGVPGVGSGLTASLKPNRGLSDVTFRTGILGESLTQFLTRKEQRCFRPDGSGVRVAFDGGGADALDYILLHEATHVIDFALGISASRDAPDRRAAIFAGIWRDRTTLAPPYAGSLVDRNVFREAEGGRAIGVGQAAALYRALAATPFVDLFASANQAEDLSSAAAFAVLRRRDGVSPKVVVRDRAGGVRFVYEPMTNPEVLARLPLVERFLQTPPA